MRRVLQLKTALILSILFFATISFGADYSHNYRPLYGTDLEHKSTWTVDYGYGLSVEYALFVEKDVFYDVQAIKSHLIKGAQHTFSYLKSKGLSAKDCRTKERVEIFTVKEVTLNDKNRFPDFKDREIVGLYDPVFAINNYSAITLAEQTPGRYNSTVVHEAAHYWYDRFCLERASLGSTEDFAEEIENMYYRSKK